MPPSCAALGFAGGAEGCWSALGWRFLTGLGDAGLYMPGLRIVLLRLMRPKAAVPAG